MMDFINLLDLVTAQHQLSQISEFIANEGNVFNVVVGQLQEFDFIAIVEVTIENFGNVGVIDVLSNE